MVAVMLKKVPLLLTIPCIFSLICYMLTVGDDLSTLNLLPTKQKTFAYRAECCLEDGEYQTDWTETYIDVLYTRKVLW